MIGFKSRRAAAAAVAVSAVLGAAVGAAAAGGGSGGAPDDAAGGPVVSAATTTVVEPPPTEGETLKRTRAAAYLEAGIAWGASMAAAVAGAPSICGGYADTQVEHLRAGGGGGNEELLDALRRVTVSACGGGERQGDAIAADAPVEDIGTVTDWLTVDQAADIELLARLTAEQALSR